MDAIIDIIGAMLDTLWLDLLRPVAMIALTLTVFLYAIGIAGTLVAKLLRPLRK